MMTDEEERTEAEKKLTLSGSILTPEVLTQRWALAGGGPAGTIWLEDGSDIVLPCWKQEHRCGPTDADRALAAHIVEAHNKFLESKKNEGSGHGP